MPTKRKSIAIIDYGMGNLHSVAKATTDAAPGWQVCITNDRRQLAHADKVIFPGVGAIGDCLAGMRALQLDQVLVEARAKGTWILAICVGFQALFASAEEFGEHQGLGFISGKVENIKNLAVKKGVDMHAQHLRIPHSGWNQLQMNTRHLNHPLFHGLTNNPWMYFVHSCAVGVSTISEQASIVATCTHGTEFVAMIIDDTTVGCQFHPEKSHLAGKTLVDNFVRL